MIPAGPTKRLYISIGLEAAIHHQQPPSTASTPPPPPRPLPPLPLTVCLPSPLACYQARYGTDGVPPFSIGRAGRGGRGQADPLYKLCCGISRRASQLATEAGRSGRCRRRFAQTITVINWMKRLSWRKQNHFSPIQAADHIAFFVSIAVFLLFSPSFCSSRTEQ